MYPAISYYNFYDFWLFWWEGGAWRSRPGLCKSRDVNKSNSFSYETFCTWAYFETESMANSEMACFVLY